jgi:hypothetical protein
MMTISASATAWACDGDGSNTWVSLLGPTRLSTVTASPPICSTISARTVNEVTTFNGSADAAVVIASREGPITRAAAIGRNEWGILGRVIIDSPIRGGLEWAGEKTILTCWRHPGTSERPAELLQNEDEPQAAECGIAVRHCRVTNPPTGPIAAEIRYTAPAKRTIDGPVGKSR